MAMWTIRDFYGLYGDEFTGLYGTSGLYGISIGLYGDISSLQWTMRGRSRYRVLEVVLGDINIILSAERAAR